MVRNRRGLWKPWNWSTRTWLLAICAAVLVSPIVIRWCCLWSVPNVALPFDPESILVDESPADNAAEKIYSEICSQLEDERSDWLGQAVFGYHAEEKWDPRFDRWASENAELLDRIEGATLRAPAKPFSQDLIHPGSPGRDPATWRFVFRLSQAVATHHLRAGRLDDAWRWHRNGMRVAHQMDAPGTQIDYAIAKGMFFSVYMLTERWAAEPSLTSEQLAVARNDVRQISSARTKLSDMMKSEYIEAEAKARQPDVADRLYPKWQLTPRIGFLESPYKRTVLWMLGEPEISLRFYRQVMVNNLGNLDQPLVDRPQEVRRTYPLVFSDQGARRASGQLSAPRLAKMLDGSLGKHLIEIDWFFWIGDQTRNTWLRGGMEMIHLRCQAETRMIDTVLAAHQYRRDRGRFPLALDQLVPEYLPFVPIDPTSRTELPLQYRSQDSSAAMILYADDAGPDLKGQIEDVGRGYRIFLNDESPAVNVE